MRQILRALPFLLAAGTLAAPLVLAQPGKVASDTRPTPAPQPKAAAPGGGKLAPVQEWILLETEVGNILLDLDEEQTPGHSANFKKLVRQGYYDGSPFHRVIDGFMAQGGGQWGPDGQPVDVGYTVPAEIKPGLTHARGTVAAARKPDQVNPQRASSGSQFYICFQPAAHLDGGYTIFGQVLKGMDAVDRLHKGGSNGLVAAGEASTIKRATVIPANAGLLDPQPK